MTSLNLFEIVLTSSGLTTATTAYTAGDKLGAQMSATISTATMGLCVGASIHDKSDITGAISCYVADRSITLGTDNAAPSISDADNFFLTPAFYFPPPDDLGSNRFASVDSLGLPSKANASNTLYFNMVTLTGHTFFGAATDIQIKLYFSLDL